jgi:hypothetical protein
MHLAANRAFKAYLAPLWATDWFVYAKRPFADTFLLHLSRRHLPAGPRSAGITFGRRRPGHARVPALLLSLRKPTILGLLRGS